jgi:hypothetical protein
LAFLGLAHGTATAQAARELSNIPLSATFRIAQLVDPANAHSDDEADFSTPTIRIPFRAFSKACGAIRFLFSFPGDDGRQGAAISVTRC